MVEYKVLNSIQMSNFINLQIKKVVATIKNANGYLKELFNHCSVICHLESNMSEQEAGRF